MKKFTKEESLSLQSLSENQIKTLHSDTRIWYNCTKCGNLVIRRLITYRKDHLQLCPACKMELHKGYRNPFSAPDFLDKKKRTFELKYGSYEEGYKACREKAERTNIEKYGGIAPLQNKVILEKFLKTNNERYGGNSPSQNEIVKQKQIETTLKNWGFRSSAQNEIVKEKSKQTCLKNFGVETGFLTKKCFDSHSRCKYEFEDERFDSSWELALWVYAKDHNEEIEREPCQFEYEFEGKKHFYYPDFLYKGGLVEVKGPQFFKDDKMICPFDRSQDELFQAKYECMKKNGVKIFSTDEIRVCRDYIKKAYGNDFLQKHMIDKIKTKLYL